MKSTMKLKPGLAVTQGLLEITQFD